MSNSMTIAKKPGSLAIFRAGFAGVMGVGVVYAAARLSGTDFSVAAPPALLSPIPLWLFVVYSAGAAASMFPIVAVSTRLPRPRAVAVSMLGLGLAAMTPAPFLVTSDFWTIFWLTSSHIALMVPLFLLSIRSLPRTKPTSVSKVR